MRALLAVTLTLAGLAACATTSESAGTSNLTQNVGIYSPAPPGITRPTVGIPKFSVTGAQAKKEMNEVAADTMTTLLVQSRRFNVIERAQLDQLLAEQDLSGIVREGEIAGKGEVRGVQYLLLGKVTNFRVKTERKKRGLGLGNVRLPGSGSIGLGDIEKEDVLVKTECGVDIRLVDPTTGSVAAAHFSEFERRDTAAAIGVEIFGANAESEADIQVSEDDYGKLLRLALDDALRRMLPDVDQMLVSQSVAGE